MLIIIMCLYVKYVVGNFGLMQAADECISHILVPESRGNVARKLVKVLKHSGSVVDGKLERMSAAETKDVELREGRPLCHLLKATGVCQ